MTNKHPQLLWIEALESGHFQQGYLQLRQRRRGQDLVDPYGVACELAVNHGLIHCWPNGFTKKTYSYGNSTQYLPEIVVDWLEIRPFCKFGDLLIPVASDDGVDMIPVSILNDFYKWTFPQIASALRDTFNYPTPTQITSSAATPRG